MSFTYNCDTKKGKKNKLKIGQKVKAAHKLVNWHATHLSWCLGRPVHDDGAYDKNQREIPIDSIIDVYAWSSAELSGKMPTGTIGHYGASDNEENIDRKNVWVNFVFKTELGNLEIGVYVEEKDLTTTKKKSKSRKK